MKLAPIKQIPYLNAQCGLFGISDDHQEKYLCLNSKFIKNKPATFFFKAAGDSMNPLILAGDILIVDRSLTFSSGRICVMELDGEFICKRYLETANGAILRSENPKHKDIIINETRIFGLFGVVSAIAREMRDY